MKKSKNNSLIKGEMSNGMRVLLIPTKNSKLVSVGMFIKAGTKYETSKNNGIAHFLEHMMFQGTKKRGGIKIATDLDNVGADYNASTSYEFTFYEIKGQISNIHLFLETIIDIYYNSKFNKIDIDREKKVVLEEMRMYNDDPKSVLEDIFHEKMYKGTSLALPILGTENNVRNFSKTDIIDFRQKFYNDDNSVLVIIGDINPTKMSLELEKIFNEYSIKKDNQNIQQQFVIKKQQRPYLFINYETKMKQTLVKIAFRTFGRNYPYSSVLQLLEEILLSGSTSRLFYLLRNKLAVTYYHEVIHDQYETMGSFVITLGIDPLRVTEVIMAVLNEIRKLKIKKISKKELNKIEKIRETNSIVQMESSIQDYIYSYGIDELFSNEINYEVDAISPQDILNISNIIFTRQNLNVFIMGDFDDEDNVIEVLSKFH